MIKRLKQIRHKLTYEDITTDKLLSKGSVLYGHMHWKYFNSWKREEMLFYINFNYRGVFR